MKQLYIIVNTNTNCAEMKDNKMLKYSTFMEAQNFYTSIKTDFKKYIIVQIYL